MSFLDLWAEISQYLPQFYKLLLQLLSQHLQPCTRLLKGIDVDKGLMRPVARQGLMMMMRIDVDKHLGETGLNVIYPADCQNEAQATGDMALVGHKAELHSLEPMASQNPQLAIAEELKQKYGQRNIAEEICPK